MARVITGRVQLSIWILISACAPSLPRQPETRATPDAAPDRPLDLMIAQPSTIPEAADAAPRDALLRDAFRDTPPDTPADLPRDTPTDLAGRLDAPIRDTGSESASSRDTGPPEADRPPDADRNIDADRDTGAESDTGGRPNSDGDAVPPPIPGDLRITELLINPAGTDTNREWIEVVNSTAHAVDLQRLTVADAAGEVALDAGVLAAGAILVLGQSLDPARNGGAPVGLSFGNVISLNNGGDLIRLCLGPCAGGVILAEVRWTADLGAAFDGHAAVVGLDPGHTDGAPDGPVFCPADQPFGTAGSFGRPGLADAPCSG